MKKYFRYVPDFDYVSRLPESKISDYVKVKNLFKKGKLRDDIFQDVTVFTKYQIVGDARPDNVCLLYTSPSPRDKRQSRMPSSA